MFIQRSSVNKDETFSIEKMDKNTFIIFELAVLNFEITNSPKSCTSYLSKKEIIKALNIIGDDIEYQFKENVLQFQTQENVKNYILDKKEYSINLVLSTSWSGASNILKITFNDYIVPFLDDLKINLRNINQHFSPDFTISNRINLPVYNDENKKQTYSFRLTKNDRNLLSKISKSHNYTSDSDFLSNLINRIANQ